MPFGSLAARVSSALFEAGLQKLPGRAQVAEADSFSAAASAGLSPNGHAEL
jgi:hypothetical protein